MRPGLLLSIFVLLSFGSAWAQEKNKPSPATATRSIGGVVTQGGNTIPPWRMSDDERVERRGRSDAGGRAKAQSVQDARYVDDVNGRQHPELFLPFELFDYLLSGLDRRATRRDNAHRAFDPGIARAGYDVDAFWETLRDVSSTYLNGREQQREPRPETHFNMPDGSRFWLPVTRATCAARYEALQTARTRLGVEKFDRLLYTVVAPQVTLSSSGNWTFAQRAEQLRYMSGGCK